jgi:hypothetical protein
MLMLVCVHENVKIDKAVKGAVWDDGGRDGDSGHRGPVRGSSRRGAARSRLGSRHGDTSGVPGLVGPAKKGDMFHPARSASTVVPDDDDHEPPDIDISVAHQARVYDYDCWNPAWYRSISGVRARAPRSGTRTPELGGRRPEAVMSPLWPTQRSCPCPAAPAPRAAHARSKNARPR